MKNCHIGKLLKVFICIPYSVSVRGIKLFICGLCLVPNPKPNAIYGKFHVRHGRTCAVPLVRNNSYRSIVSSSFVVHSSQLFNCLPKEIRDLSDCSKETFKSCLDKFLRTVPDEPLITGYTRFRRADSNSLLDMVKFSSYEEKEDV